MSREGIGRKHQPCTVRETVGILSVAPFCRVMLDASVHGGTRKCGTQLPQVSFLRPRLRRKRTLR